MAHIPVLPAKAPAAEVIASLLHAGCVVVNDAIDKASREELGHELAAYLERADPNANLNKTYADAGFAADFYPGNTRRITALVAKSKRFRSFVTHPLMLSAATRCSNRIARPTSFMRPRGWWSGRARRCRCCIARRIDSTFSKCRARTWCSPACGR